MSGITPDERLYLEQLCDRAKGASEVSGEIMISDEINVSHPSDSIKDRLDDLVDRTNLVKKNSNDAFELTKEGREEIC